MVSPSRSRPEDDPPEDKRSRKGRERNLRRRLKRILGVDLLAIPTIASAVVEWMRPARYDDW